MDGFLAAFHNASKTVVERERERARELRNGRGRRQKRGDKLNSIVFLGGIGHFEEGKKEGGNEGDSNGDEGERGGAD